MVWVPSSTPPLLDPEPLRAVVGPPNVVKLVGFTGVLLQLLGVAILKLLIRHLFVLAEIFLKHR
eukprot:348637-Pyramimonas_sp.AAC.1